MAGRPQNAYRWRFLNKNMRFMQVLGTFLIPYAPRALRGIKNMQKQTVKRNILIKWCERSAFLSHRFLEPLKFGNIGTRDIRRNLLRNPRAA